MGLHSPASNGAAQPAAASAAVATSAGVGSMLLGHTQRRCVLGLRESIKPLCHHHHLVVFGHSAVTTTLHNIRLSVLLLLHTACSSHIFCQLHNVVVCPLCTSHTTTTTDAQPGDPVGTATECGPGRTYRVKCYFDAAGYLSDIAYSNTIPPTEVAVCNAPEKQLEQSTSTQLETSASDSIVRLKVCADSHGVRGVAFHTLLGERLHCGLTMGRCTTLSSRGLYPLAGFSGSCIAPHGRNAEGRAKFTVVTALFGACWNTQTAAVNTGVCVCVCVLVMCRRDVWVNHSHASFHFYSRVCPQGWMCCDVPCYAPC